MKPQHYICAHSYYSKQYCLLFFLTTLLPIQDVPRHISVLPIHTLSHVLGLERILLDHYKSKTCIIWSKVCLIVYKKMAQTKGCKQEEQKKKLALLYCLQYQLCAHIMLGYFNLKSFVLYFSTFLVVDLCYSVNISHPGKASHIYHVI